MDSQENRYKSYEVTYLVKEEDGSLVSELIGKNGGVIIEERALTKVQLAYPIQKNDQAFMGVIVFDMLPEKTELLRKTLQLKDEVLRAMILVYTPVVENKKPSLETSELSSGEKVESGDGADASSLDKPNSKPIGVSVEELTNEALEKKIKEISE